MTSKYGVTIRLRGSKSYREQCVSALTAAMRECFTDSYDGQVSYTLKLIPGSYWAAIRHGDERSTTDDIVVTYMMTEPAFWSDSHEAAIRYFAVQWPSLTQFMYGDSYEAGDGCRALHANGQLVVNDVFHLDENDRPSDVTKRAFGEGISNASLHQHLPAEFADAFCGQVSENPSILSRKPEVVTRLTPRVFQEPSFLEGGSND